MVNDHMGVEVQSSLPLPEFVSDLWHKKWNPSIHNIHSKRKTSSMNNFILNRVQGWWLIT